VSTTVETDVMANGVFVGYMRVSTQRQGASGLGLEAQEAAIAQFLNGGNWTIAAKFVEVESGKNNARAELAKAIQACRVYGAKLLIAKLDRLSRDAHFLLGLEKAGVDFIAVDMPSANRLTVGIMAMVAEEERHMISARTKAALRAAKARGKRLGGFRGVKIDDAAREASIVSRKDRAVARAADLSPIVMELRAAGVTSLGAIARELTARNVPTARGGSGWTPTQVSRLISRL